MKPRKATIRLINTCNARCKMCEVWREKNITQFDNSLLNKLPESLRSISLSGGEPFLRNDLSEIVEKIKLVCSKSRIVILTNGILTDVIIKQMEKIIKINPRIAIRLSIDGIGEIQDNIRGVRNAYISSLNTLKALKRLKILDLGVTITISDINIGEIGKVYKIAEEEKVKFNCQVVHSSDFYYGAKNKGISQKDLLKKEINAIILSDLKSLSLQRLFKAYYYKGMWNYINRLPRSNFCNAGSLFFYLSQEGNVYPCLLLNKEIGNLQNDNFNTIWNSKLAYRVREYVKNCNLNCWMICTVAPGIKNNPFRAARWVFINKLKAHLRRPNLL